MNLLKTISEATKTLSKAVKDNLPKLLIYGGTTLLGLAVADGVYEGYKANDDIRQLKEEKAEELSVEPEEVTVTKGEVLKKTWPRITRVVTLTATGTAAILMGEKKYGKELTVLTAAYLIQKDNREKLTESVKEILPEELQEQINDKIAEKKSKEIAEQRKESETNEAHRDSGQIGVLEPFTGQTVWVDSWEDIKEAMNRMMYKMNKNDGQGSINDWLDCLGLVRGELFDDIGWNLYSLSYGYVFNDIIDKGKCDDPNGRPGWMIVYNVDPDTKFKEYQGR